MNNFFTQLKTIGRTQKLTASEKQAMRVRLYTYFEQHPIEAFVAPAPVARPVPSTFFFFSPRYLVPVALILMVGLGSGTAFAAQGALPGDALYPVKINVNEAVQTALATTPEAKAQVNAQLATTRLEEAETLAATGKLDATTTAALASNFTEHADAAVAVTNSIKANDPGTAAQLGANFNSTLAAHGALLAEIADDSKSDETMQNSNTLAMAVQQEATDDSHQTEDAAQNNNSTVVAIASVTPAAAPAPRMRTFAAAMPTASNTATSSATASAPAAKAKGKIAIMQTNPNDAKIAAPLAAQASTSIAAMMQDYAALQSSLDATTAAQLSTQITAVEVQAASASAELSAGNNSSAVRDFAAVIRTSIKLDAYFKAGKNINIKLLSGLLTTTPTSVQNTGGNEPIQTPTTTTTSSTSVDTSSNGNATSNSSDINVGNSATIETNL